MVRPSEAAMMGAMNLYAICHPVAVNTGGADERGCLVFVANKLVGVLVRLEPAEHVEPELWGKWYVEAGFGPCDVAARTLIFDTWEEAQTWARRRVARAARSH